MVRGKALGTRCYRQVPQAKAWIPRRLRKAARALGQGGLRGEDWALLAVALGVALLVVGGR
jgi:hypothetical protein